MEFLSYLNKIGNPYNLIYGNVKNLNILKFYNLKVYMHLGLCMLEIFDIIFNAFKYKYETFQVFIHPFKKIMMF